MSTNPRIAYQNILDSAYGATITCDDGAVAGFEYQNAYDYKPFTYWQPATGGTHYIQAVFGGGQSANYFAFYAQDIYKQVGTITLQYSTNSGSTWTTVASATVQTSAPVYLFFNAVSASYWRVVVTATNPWNLGVVSFGVDMTFQQGFYVGFVPPVLGRSTVITSTISDNGTFLGRSLIRNMAASSISLDQLTPAWVRSAWYPFMLSAELKPFFLLWNSANYLTEAAFCWVNAAGDIAQPKNSSVSYMSAGVKFLCRTD